jgi:hypothetical protein
LEKLSLRYIFENINICEAIGISKSRGIMIFSFYREDVPTIPARQAPVIIQIGENFDKYLSF